MVVGERGPMYAYANLRLRLTQTLRDPVAWTEAIQAVKTVVAAVVAWVVAAEVFDLPQPFLAPWSALLVVHATVYRTFWKGAKQIVATVLGVLLAWGTGQTLGLDPTALAVMLLAALAIGSVRWLDEEATTVATTALIVLTTGFSDEDQVLIGRLYDAAIGVGVGLVVNALVWPPLRDLTAARAIEEVGKRVGVLLGDMARDMKERNGAGNVQEWVRRSQELDGAVGDTWALVRQARESGRLNPRGASAVVREPGEFGEVLDRTEQSLAEIRSMARTIEHSITDTNEWDEEFRDRWTELLQEVGWAIANPDSRRLGEVRTKLHALTSDYSTQQLSALHWSEYGGVILNLRNIATSMDRVAASDPVSESVRSSLARQAANGIRGSISR